MKCINMRKKSPYAYRAVIFDLDGTLYYQKPFRLCMIRHLVGYIVVHPTHVRDFLIIKKYREVREKWEDCAGRCGSDPKYANLGLDEMQYQYVADQMRVKRAKVKSAIDFYMLEMPLRLLPAYKDEMLANMIDELHKLNKTVVVYSDYPVENKLAALGIKADACYTSADERINSMKPDPRGLAVILKDIGCPADEALMIGDRYEKDGLAAEGNGVDYMIVDSSRKKRGSMLISHNL